jgi:hypothetical protein
MKKGLIFTVMLVGVLVSGFAQTALSGTYRYDANFNISFTGNTFNGSWGSSTMSGTYSVSGTRLTLSITGGTVGRNTWNWTIVDANTLRDHDGDNWSKGSGGSAQNSGRQTSNPYADTRWRMANGNDSLTLTMTDNGFTFVIIAGGRTANNTGTYTYDENNIRFLVSGISGEFATATVFFNFMFFKMQGANEVRLTIQSGEFKMNGTTLVRYYGGADNVIIPAGVTSIGDSAFNNHMLLTSITIPSSVTSIRDFAFFGCIALTSVTIPSSVTSIGNSVFGMCASLRSITIPSGVTSIGDFVFNDCGSLTNINVDAQNREFSSVDGVLFNKNRTELITYPAGKQGNYTIPSSVTTIKVAAFYSCKNLTGVTIPSSVTAIRTSAFEECVRLTSITIPSSVTLIGPNAFEESGLTSIIIPSSVTRIYDEAFKGCASLRTVTISRRTALGANVFPSTARITYSDEGGGSTNDFEMNGTVLVRYRGSAANVTIPAGVTSIGAGAFRNNSNLTNITIPSSVDSIGGGAFEGCTSLTSVAIPSSVTSIGRGAFEGCTSLTSVTIPSSVTSIGEMTFNGCSNLTSITISSGVVFIDNRAFNGCSSLTSITIPSSVINIGNGAFRGCTNLRTVTVSRRTTIGNDAFPSTARITYSD